jgi:hypothetical protein
VLQATDMPKRVLDQRALGLEKLGELYEKAARTIAGTNSINTSEFDLKAHLSPQGSKKDDTSKS